MQCYFASNGQLKITQATFEGKTYNVYPVRIPIPDRYDYDYYGDFERIVDYVDFGEIDYDIYDIVETTKRSAKKNKKKKKDTPETYWNQWPKEQFLPYNPFKIPDGNYLVFYEKRAVNYDEWGNPIYSHADTTLVAAIFTIKNNRKNGSATWYDYSDEQHIIQTGGYENGEKSGEWNLYSEFSKETYSYKNGLLNGEHKKWRGDRLTFSANYVLGVINGQSITYYDEKPYHIKTEYNYNFGLKTEHKKYNAAGKLEEHFVADPVDGINYRLYEGGVLKQTTSQKIDSFGFGEHITFYSKNGNIVSDFEKWYYYYYYYSYLNKSLTFDFLTSQKFMTMAQTINGMENCKKYKSYWPNGQVELEYDLDKDTFTKPVYRYDQEGRITNKYERDPVFNFYLHEYEYNPENGQLISEKTKSGSYSSLMEKEYDQNGVVVKEHYSSKYLDSLHKNETGFILKSATNRTYGKKNKEIEREFYLLHSPYISFKTNEFNGRVISSFSSNQFLDSITKKEMVEAFVTEYGQDTSHKVVHRFAFPVYSLQNKKSYGGVSYSDKVLELSKAADSLNYTVFANGETISGQVRLVKYERSKKFKPYKYSFTYDEKLSEKLQDYVYEVTINPEADDFFKNYMYRKPGMERFFNRKKFKRNKNRDYDYYGYGKKKFKPLRKLKYALKRKKNKHAYPVYEGYYGGRYHSHTSHGISPDMSRARILLSQGKPYEIGGISYQNNKKQGEVTSYNSSAYYKDGLLHGRAENGGGMAEYYKGMVHGLVLDYGYTSPEEELSTQIKYKAYYTLDTLHGPFQSFVRPQELSQTVTFEKGFPHGKYWQGNVTAPTSVEATLHHGYLIDTGYYYFKEGNLKAKVFYRLQDSVYYASVQNNEYMRYYPSTKTKPVPQTGYEDLKGMLLHFNNYNTADYTYYYKNNVVAAVGRVENRQKVGSWDYFDLNGQLHKRVMYDTGWHVNPITNDSTRYYGTVEMWRPDGTKLLKGLILNSEERFRCDQEMEVDFERLLYTEFYDSIGNQTLDYEGGKIYEYQNNGLIRLEGEFKYGKRDGVWKFYDPNGRLEEIGKYEDGKRAGLWVKGDLEAVPYYENMCVKGDVNAYQFPDIDETNVVVSPIRITETRYGASYDGDVQYIKLLPLF
ncbi:MAG: hypothetical protein H6607_02320 [Flavobacteriales bacterium]|nr:hypothetical protein [Flavobacteriales bacterium]